MKYFVEIVEAGSYSRAAANLHIAQSALSRQVKELENTLEAQLLQRDARHIALTDAGRLFYQRSKRMLQELTETVAQTRHIGDGGQGTIRLLHSSSVTLPSALGAALHRLLTGMPGVALDVSMTSSDHQGGDIAAGRADLGLVRLPVLRQHPDIIVAECGNEPLLLAVPPGHRLAGAGITDIAGLRDELFVSIPHPERGGLSYLVAGLCQAHGFFPRAARATSRKTSLLRLVAAGFGIAIIPDSMRAVAPLDICFVALPPEVRSAVALVRRRDPSPLVASFASALEKQLEQVWGGDRI